MKIKKVVITKIFSVIFVLFLIMSCTLVCDAASKKVDYTKVGTYQYTTDVTSTITQAGANRVEEKVYDEYTITVEKLPGIFEYVPLKAYYINYVTCPTNFSFTMSNQENNSYSVGASITSSVSAKVGAKESVLGVGEAYSEISASLSATLNSTISSSTIAATSQTYNWTVDGSKEHPYGVHAVLLLAKFAYKTQITIKCESYKQIINHIDEGSNQHDDVFDYELIDSFETTVSAFIPYGDIGVDESFLCLTTTCYYPTLQEYYDDCNR